ncbi:50S ribosomal protein L9 [Chlamydia pecorum]|uniref:Large ribosomal subunit protein bL9 n=2 Tax=Chlamydia pecorum TaxID=85991 RepID=A0AA34RCC0_CHLPE|nr:50S ribosomal protein L9 [Chlamydia pecorum]AEB41113.1 ribosomal protein L9 [Chlamydia pecorum E58]AGW38250.1 50S ribosomal protein L9 [Chlamydia pecorum PV3056/3]AGW39175.1 50S ribosomal protein L9 [Chlamydia pecorum W73]AGW40101.1 50S ribosomal protein L9 [Chlamydia pecorum P787]ETF38467.1 50S ribosomal protein L9 [Chlamydia pecorum VR629]
MKQQLLLLEDIEGLGRSGDVVTARPGYVRNFLLPQQKAVIAGTRTLRLQAKLKEQRMIQAAEDKAESEKLAEMLKDIVLEFQVRVDPDNNMYGSVTIADIIAAAEEKNISLSRKSFPAHFAIKSLGRKNIPLKLKEGVSATLIVHVASDSEYVVVLEESGASESAEGIE